VVAQYVPSGRRANEIADDIHAAVMDGRAATGTMLPPVRTLASSLGLSPGTVAAAYRLLARRGVVEGRGRSGTWVRARPAPAVRGALEVPPGLVDLARGNPDPDLLPALAPVVSLLDLTPRLYGGPTVLPALAAAVRPLLAADGVDGGALAVTGGALDAIERVLMVVAEPGDRVAVEDPGYGGVLDLLSALELLVEPVAIDRHGALPDGPGGLASALRRGVAAVVLTPRAHNPTGATFDAARAADLRAVLDGHPDVVVIEDDHAGPAAGAPLHTVVGSGRRAVAIRSFSKVLGPDLRLAVVAGDDITLGRLEGRQLVGAGWVSHLQQQIVAGLLDSPVTQSLVAEAARAYADRRQALVAALQTRGVAAQGDSGLNVWVPVVDEPAVVQGMAQRGWAVAAGHRFRTNSAPGVRLTTAALEADRASAVADDLVASLRRTGHTRPG
jgi:DNA-binding transcriptional MocR family regulator